MRAVRLRVENQDGVSILIPEGELVTGEADALLEREFDRLLTTGQARAVIDLSGVTYVDSSVLGKLVHGHTRMLEKGGALRLLNPPKRVLELLRVTRLISVFEIVEDGEEAANL